MEKMTQKFAPDGEETGEDVDVRRFRVKEGRMKPNATTRSTRLRGLRILHEKGGADAGGRRRFTEDFEG